MGARTDLFADVNRWLNRDYSDDEMMSFLMIAENSINNACRVADQIQIDTAVVENQRVLLPPDWIELDFVRIVDGAPLHYISREEMYSSTSDQVKLKYTVTGNYLISGPALFDGSTVEMAYFQDIPTLDDATGNWAYKRQYPMLLFGMQAAAELYGLHDERAAAMNNQFTAIVNVINTAFRVSRSSGSTLRGPVRRSLG